jgi:hypothetical protein
MTSCLHLIIQYCGNPNPERVAEYDTCVRRNLANPQIARVHNLAVKGTAVPEEFRAHPKHRRFELGAWMTFQDAFIYANTFLTGETVCVANLDIFLDADSTDWKKAAETVGDGIVLCLSRTEFDPDGASYLDSALAPTAFAFSQDAWVFRAPIDIPGCDFEIGTLGCDNAIAHRLRAAGRLPVNDPQQFKVFHYDRCRGKTEANGHAVHAHERARQVLEVSKHPERQGFRFVPDIQKIRELKFDQVITSFRLDELERYSLFCEMLWHISQMRHVTSLGCQESTGQACD